jgi:hypothetical protein
MTSRNMVGNEHSSPWQDMERPFEKNVLIACRVRPLNETERQRKDQDVVNIPDEGAALWVGSLPCNETE